MKEMVLARFNLEWFLSLLVPATLMLLVTYRHRKSLLVIGVILSLAATYSLCNLSVEKKWRTRAEIAATNEEKAYAYSDGANLVFTAFFIAPFESVLYTTIWGVVGWRAWPWIRKRETCAGPPNV